MAGPHVEVVTTSDSDDDLGILQTTAGNAERGFPLQAAERIYAGLASQTSSFNMEDVLSCMRMSIAALENETRYVRVRLTCAECRDTASSWFG
eukprot:357832-Chlamydomonas_euryale.AAC.6